ncbi:hypothetical protein [Pleionea sp. CnH1-48]|uniref:hypothetical protein n=1 Tax=Pleionea sp. CnH1-48 TaxID=2954494 RepID=UPI0020973B5B|nr:hypothetical protein [Pleionea sp. CnH1-48]MCO7225582.1 hypothetical protein [Pleionea sp. CnH1-48]
MLKNKHITVALLVAPCLALISYFAVDYLVSQPAQRAEKGQSYVLVEKPNCRYLSGLCELKNGDVSLTLSATKTPQSKLFLRVESKVALDGIVLALVEPIVNEVSKVKDITAPETMASTNASNKSWSIEVPYPKPGQRLRVAASAAGTHYYGEASTVFIDMNP